MYINNKSTVSARQRFALLEMSRLIMLALVVFSTDSFSQNRTNQDGRMDVGVAHIDITPEGSIRLAGYGARVKTESEGVIRRLNAKALAFGSDVQKPSVLITVDLVGIPAHITETLADKLSEKAGLERAQLVICSSHTHGGPEVGNLLNILQHRGENFSDSLLALDQLIHISEYIDQLSRKLEEVALAALADRKPALVAWGQGQASFAQNRRTPGGPVDHALPLLRVTDLSGKLRAVLVSYACHGTTLGGDVNKIHADWIGEAQAIIEMKHPGVTAMIALGCAGDANPQPRGELDQISLHGQEISDAVDKILASSLKPLPAPPIGKIKWVKLPFDYILSVPDLIKQTKDISVKGYYARLALERIARGESIPENLSYPIQTWVFGNELAMVNLAGEVVVDYSLRLKKELGADHLWINAYSNDVPCYIASKRIIEEGGYEAESSMYYYDKPAPFAVEVEDIIISTVHELLPMSFKKNIN